MTTARRPHTAMVLAAGLGTRMRPLTDRLPKPLVPLAGRPMLDHILDRLSAAGISKAVVNVHYLADQIERHLQGRTSPQIVISDERGVLLETGGGVVRALPMLGDGAFLIHNSDSVWIEHDRPGNQMSNISRMLDAWDGDRMDSLLLLAPSGTSLGYNGRGDFHLNADGTVTRRAADGTAPYVFAGVSIMHPKLFTGETERPFSLNIIWDRAIAANRLFAMPLDGLWMHVGTPEALADANAAIAAAKVSPQ